MRKLIVALVMAAVSVVGLNPQPALGYNNAPASVICGYHEASMEASTGWGWRIEDCHDFNFFGSYAVHIALEVNGGGPAQGCWVDDAYNRHNGTVYHLDYGCGGWPGH